MRTFTITNTDSFELQTCITCGIYFLIPNSFGDELRKSKKAFYCPNGHSQSYSKSTADELREKLDAVTKERDIKQERINNLSRELDQCKAQRRPATRKKTV